MGFKLNNPPYKWPVPIYHVDMEDGVLGKANKKTSNVDNKDKIGRNDPCPEGCGIKYKKCGIDDRCIKISETK